MPSDGCYTGIICIFHYSITIHNAMEQGSIIDLTEVWKDLKI